MEFHGVFMEFLEVSIEFHGMPYSSMDCPLAWSSMEFDGVSWSIDGVLWNVMELHNWL